MKKTLTILLIFILLVGVGVAFTVLADTTEGSNSTINTESLAGSPAIPEISQVELEPRIDFESFYTVSDGRVVLSAGEKLSAIKETLSAKKQSLSVTEFEQILGATASLMKQYEKIEIPYTKDWVVVTYIEKTLEKGFHTFTYHVDCKIEQSSPWIDYVQFNVSDME